MKDVKYVRGPSKPPAHTRHHCILCNRWRPRSDYALWTAGENRKVSAVCTPCRERTKVLRKRAYDRRRYQRNHRSKRYPSEPITVLVRERLENTTQERLAQDLGISSRYVRAMAKGRYNTLNLETADKWCMGLGLHLDIVFNDEGDE